MQVWTRSGKIGCTDQSTNSGCCMWTAFENPIEDTDDIDHDQFLAWIHSRPTPDFSQPPSLRDLQQREDMIISSRSSVTGDCQGEPLAFLTGFPAFALTCFNQFSRLYQNHELGVEDWLCGTPKPSFQWTDGGERLLKYLNIRNCHRTHRSPDLSKCRCTP